MSLMEDNLNNNQSEKNTGPINQSEDVSDMSIQSVKKVVIVTSDQQNEKSQNSNQSEKTSNNFNQSEDMKKKNIQSEETTSESNLSEIQNLNLKPNLSSSSFTDDDICYTNCEILSCAEEKTNFSSSLMIAMTVLDTDSILRLEADGQNVSTVNKSGQVMQTIAFDVESCDLAVTDDGEILLACYHEESIMKLSLDGEQSVFVKTPGRKPMAIDVDKNSGEIWVAFVEEGEDCGYIASLKMFYKDGTVLQCLHYHDQSHSHYPMKISICPANGNLAISETKVDMDRESMVATILSPWGTERWVYPSNEDFNIEDAEFDCASNLLVTVPCDKSVHLVGEEGKLLRIIYQCDMVPQVLTTSLNGILWIWCQGDGEEEFEMKTVRYLKE